jgi:NAD dependent epimerase/dehydratase
MNWTGRRVLVTGAGGFIGSHLTASLVRAGADVRAMVHYNSRNDWGQLDDVEADVRSSLDVRSGDVRDPFFVSEAVRGCDIVLHLAALIGIPYSYVAPQSYVDTNITGTVNVLEAGRRHGVSRIVHTSTSETYGSAQYVPIDEEHPLQGQSPYSATKIGADKLSESYWRSFETPVVTVRPFNTFGPRQSLRAVIPNIIVQALASDTIRLGSLDPVRDLTYVEDTVSGFMLAALADGVVGETINLGTGRGVTIAELVQVALKVLGLERQVVADEQRIRPEKSEVTALISENAKARRLLGWQPEYSLEQGIAALVPWYRANLSRYRANVYTV